MVVAIALFGLAGCTGDEIVGRPQTASVAGVTAPPSPPGRAPVVPVPLPSGRPILRDCDGSLGLGGPSGIGPFGILSATGCSSSLESAPPDMQSAPVAADAAEEAPPAEPEPPPSAPAPTAASPPPAPAPAFAGPASSRDHSGPKQDAAAGVRKTAPDDGRFRLGGEGGDGHAGGKDAANVVTKHASDSLRGKTASGETADKGLLDRERRVETTPTVPDGNRYDWGGTAFLSNDDSMSLASAQRVLWALAHGQPIAASQVRKHELLNYFSFDTVAPPAGRTFGVLGAAEQDGDVLTVSMAVRGANPARQPLDLTVVVDRSGSMSAEGKMNFTKRGLHELVQGLQTGDRLDLVLFDDKVCTPVEGFVVGRDSTAILDQVIDRLAPRGATDLAAGLNEAWRIQTGRTAADVHGRDRRILLVTDAQLNSGNVDENLVSEVGKKLDQQDIHLSGVGVGQDFNDQMLEKLTEKGRGAYVFLGSEAVVDRVFGTGFDSLVRTVANDVHFSLDLPPSLAMKRFYGEESSSVAADVKPVEFHAGTAQLFLQDLAIRDGRVVPSDPITLKVSYLDPLTSEPVVEELRTTVGALLDADPHNLRKGQALMAFSDWVVALADGDGACGAPVQGYWKRAAGLRDDAEITYVSSLVSQRCGAPPRAIEVASVELKVKLDSDVPVSAVDVDCGGDPLHRSLTTADSVARFDVTPGLCTVQLQAATPMAADLEVPATGVEVSCRVRGGRMQCG